MKYEWKKSEKDIYLPKVEPTLIKIPKYKYFTISGIGNPNKPDFSDKIGALYSLAYAIRMMPKSGYTPNNYFEYTVYPLEGIWDLTIEGRKNDTFNKDELVYKIMIRQPDFVDEVLFAKALAVTKKKKPNPLLDLVKLEEIEDGLCVQVMHVGSYDDEPRSFAKIDEYLKDSNYERKDKTHREIYLSDFRKTDKDKLKTVLRTFIKTK